MKINNNFLGFDVSAAGLNIQRKKMNLIAENIANSQTTKSSETGEVYKKKFLVVHQEAQKSAFNVSAGDLSLLKSDSEHLPKMDLYGGEDSTEIITEVAEDSKAGDLVYMPEHPDANEKGYVQMPNVNIVTEMVDMIASARSYEANITALNTSKQLAKDSLEI